MKQKTKFKQTEIGKIPEDWDVKSFEETDIEIIDGDRGTNYPKQEEFENKGYCLFLSTKNTPDYKFDFSDSVFVTKERDGLLRKGKLIRGDIVLTTRGTVGNIALYDEKVSFENIRINSGMVILRNKNNFNTNFLYLLLRSSLVREQFSSFATGSAQPQLPIRDINKIKLIVPPLSEQHAIAKILSSLDEKIELNNKINKTLEAIGQALFKKWFIDERKEEWKNGKLGELGKIQPGFAFKSSDFTNNGIGLLKIRNIQNFVVEINNLESYLPEEFFDKHNKFHLESGDVLIAMTGAKIGKIGIIPKTEKKLLLNQRVGRVNSKNKYLMYLILSTSEIQGLITGGSSASSAQGNISNSDIENFDYIIPPKETIEKINNVLNPLFEKIIENLGQNQKLSQIRDALLPKLMSGEIRIKSAANMKI